MSVESAEGARLLQSQREWNMWRLHGYRFAVGTIKSLALAVAHMVGHLDAEKAVQLAFLEQEFQVYSLRSLRSLPALRSLRSLRSLRLEFL